MLRGFAIYVIFVLKIISESGGDQDMGQDSMWGVGSEARLRFESRVRVGVGQEPGSGQWAAYFRVVKFKERYFLYFKSHFPQNRKRD